jgi:N12 class adenine-specific DNA methylase
MRNRLKGCKMKNCKEARAWDDAFDREFYTPEEISESDMRADIITAMIEAREEMRVIKGG